MDFIMNLSPVEIMIGFAVIGLAVKFVLKVSKLVFTLLLIVGGYMVLSGTFNIDIISMVSGLFV